MKDKSGKKKNVEIMAWYIFCEALRGNVEPYKQLRDLCGKETPKSIKEEMKN